MSINKKSLKGFTPAKAKEVRESGGSKKSENSEPVKLAAAKKLAMAKLATAKLSTARLAFKPPGK